MSTAARKTKSRPRTALQADTLTEQAYNRLEEMIVALHDIGEVLARPALAQLARIGRAAELDSP